MKKPTRLNPHANPEEGKTPKCSCFDEAWQNLEVKDYFPLTTTCS